MVQSNMPAALWAKSSLIIPTPSADAYQKMSNDPGESCASSLRFFAMLRASDRSEIASTHNLTLAEISKSPFRCPVEPPESLPARPHAPFRSPLL